MTATKERPILFSGPMVRAIRDGRKTQTRRVVKWEPHEPGLNLSFSGLSVGHYMTGVPASGFVLYSRRRDGCWEQRTKPLHCPYGEPGGWLWVREAWRCNHVGGMRIEYKAGGACLEFDQWPKDVVPPYALPTSAAQVRRAERQLNGEKIPDAWRPSIHMPRWASRLTLEITSVRVERLQEITEADAVAEGLRPQEGDPGPGPGYKWRGTGYEGCYPDHFHTPSPSGLCFCRAVRPKGSPSRPRPSDAVYPDTLTPARCAYRELWDVLNAKRGFGWDANPWVQVVGFRQLEAA